MIYFYSLCQHHDKQFYFLKKYNFFLIEGVIFFVLARQVEFNLIIKKN